MHTNELKPARLLCDYDLKTAINMLERYRKTGCMLAGSSGTIVAVWGDGKAYEIEFEHPFHAIITVQVQDVEILEGSVVSC